MTRQSMDAIVPVTEEGSWSKASSPTAQVPLEPGALPAPSPAWDPQRGRNPHTMRNVVTGFAVMHYILLLTDVSSDFSGAAMPRFAIILQGLLVPVLVGVLCSRAVAKARYVLCRAALAHQVLTACAIRTSHTECVLTAFLPFLAYLALCMHIGMRDRRTAHSVLPKLVVPAVLIAIAASIASLFVSWRGEPWAFSDWVPTACMANATVFILLHLYTVRGEAQIVGLGSVGSDQLHAQEDTNCDSVPAARTCSPFHSSGRTGEEVGVVEAGEGDADGEDDLVAIAMQCADSETPTGEASDIAVLHSMTSPYLSSHLSAEERSEDAADVFTSDLFAAPLHESTGHPGGNPLRKGASSPNSQPTSPFQRKYNPEGGGGGGDASGAPLGQYRFSLGVGASASPKNSPTLSPSSFALSGSRRAMKPRKTHAPVAGGDSLAGAADVAADFNRPTLRRFNSMPVATYQPQPAPTSPQDAQFARSPEVAAQPDTHKPSPGARRGCLPRNLSADNVNRRKANSARKSRRARPHSDTAPGPGDKTPPLSSRNPARRKSFLNQRTVSMDVSWRLGGLIGSGGFGTVHIGLNESSGQPMAVKTIKFDPHAANVQNRLAMLANEIQLMRTLHHPCLVSYYFAERVESSLHIFMEYVPGGSLLGVLQQFGPLSDNLAATYTPQILLGLAYLHSQGVVHRDIKCANVLLTAEGMCKLADFGSAACLERVSTQTRRDREEVEGAGPHTLPGPVVRGVGGAPLGMAPEVLAGQQHGWACDIWSLGCCVMEMLTAEAPFAHIEDALDVVVRGDGPVLLPGVLNAEGNGAFVAACLLRNPECRPSAATLLCHDWVVGDDASPVSTPSSFGGHVSPVSTPRSLLSSPMRTPSADTLDHRARVLGEPLSTPAELASLRCALRRASSPADTAFKKHVQEHTLRTDRDLRRGLAKSPIVRTATISEVVTIQTVGGSGGGGSGGGGSDISDSEGHIRVPA